MLIGDQTSFLETLSINTPRVFRAKAAAAIFKRKRLLAVGYNKDKTHPLQGRFCKHPDALFLHAEIDAILKCRDISKAHRIFVSRHTRSGGFGSAKPCPICQDAINTMTPIKIIEHT